MVGAGQPDLRMIVHKDGENHAGEELDFHALRHTCGAWLAMAGVHPKVVRTVMRHSTITLTMDTYGQLFPGDESQAVARLPRMFDVDPAANQRSPLDDPQRIRQRALRQVMQPDAAGCSGVQRRTLRAGRGRRWQSVTHRSLMRPRAVRCTAAQQCLLKDSNLEPAD